MSETRQERDKAGGIAETVPCRPDLLLAEYLELMDAEAKAGIDGGRMDDTAVERRRALKEELYRAIDEDHRLVFKEERRRALKEERRRALKEEHCRALKEERRRAIDEEHRRAIDEEHRRAIDWQIMVGNHRDLANVYARMMLLGSC